MDISKRFTSELSYVWLSKNNNNKEMIEFTSFYLEKKLEIFLEEVKIYRRSDVTSDEKLYGSTDCLSAVIGRLER